MSNSVNTYTNTNTFTYTRLGIINVQFDLFFQCAGMDEETRKKHIKSIEAYELQAVGVYLAKDGIRIAEVELRVDWTAHQENIRISGDVFNADIPGWKNGTAPEPYIVVQKLVQLAKQLGLNVRHWIQVSDSVGKDSSLHQQVCNKLGYNHGSKVEPWGSGGPKEESRPINGLSELTVVARVSNQ